MIAAVEYLESLGAFEFDKQSLNKFISLLEQEEDKMAKKSATDFLLHIVQPNSDLVEVFIKSDLVRGSIDLRPLQLPPKHRRMKNEELLITRIRTVNGFTAAA